MKSRAKKIFISLMFISTLICFQINLFAQGWRWLNPLPFGDSVQDIFFVDKNHGWMAPQNTTLYKTIDGGINWRIVYTDLLFENIFFINSNEGWGIGRTDIAYETNSIYHTIDGGETWEIQLADTSVRYEIFFINDKIGWATGDFSGTIDNYSHLFKTTDGGITWNLDAINQLGIHDSYKGVHFLNDLKGWLVGELSFGVMTTNGGETWVRDSSLASVKKIISYDSLLLWGLSDYDFILRTSDGGETWAKHKIIDTTKEVRPSDFYALNKDTLYVSCNLGFFISTNSGVNFSLLSTEVRSTFTFAAPQQVWAAQFSAIYHSTDGGKNLDNLLQTNNEFGDGIYYAVDFVNENIGWVAGDRRLIGTGCFIIKTTNGGINWQTQYSSPTGTFRDIKFLDENKGWAVGGSGLILKTTNGGTDWLIKNSGENYSINKITFTDSLNGWASGGNFSGGSIIKTTDGGETWSDVTPSFNISISHALYFIDSLTGWVSAGYGSGEGHLLKTTDGGKNWIIQRQAFGMYFDALYAKNYQDVWAGGYDPQLDRVLIYSSDGGENWMSTSLVSQGVYDIIFSDENTGWLISFREVFHTTNGGESWEKQKSYSTRNLNSVDFVNNKTGWIVGIFGTILHTSNGGLTFLEDSENFLPFPEEINLFQNYPNPFNPVTNIRINLNSYTDNAALDIYNLLGQKVTTLFNGSLHSGDHSFQWNGTDSSGKNVSSGIYFALLKSKGKISVIKMIKIK